MHNSFCIWDWRLVLCGLYLMRSTEGITKRWLLIVSSHGAYVQCVWIYRQKKTGSIYSICERGKRLYELYFTVRSLLDFIETYSSGWACFFFFLLLREWGSVVFGWFYMQCNHCVLVYLNFIYPCILSINLFSYIYIYILYVKISSKLTKVLLVKLWVKRLQSIVISERKKSR